jgi:predicted NBD/HSP70 family sugar kinase
MTKRIAIGVDVGGTKIAIAAVDVRTGNILLRDEIPTLRHEGGHQVLDRLYGLVLKTNKELTGNGIHPVGMGIGIPELVNNSGIIKSNWNFDWSDCDIVTRLSDFGPVLLESDARTVVLAEAAFGHGKVFPSFVFVTVGSGLSYSFCDDGKIHRGANGYAIHFASSDIMAVCKACGAQDGFNLEALACGRGLAKTYEKQTGQKIDVRDLTQKSAGKPESRLLEQATNALSSYLGQLINIFDPHAMIIGGGLGMDPYFFKMLSEKTRPFIWAPDCRSVPILSSSILKDGAAIGAATLFG